MPAICSSCLNRIGAAMHFTFPLRCVRSIAKWNWPRFACGWNTASHALWSPHNVWKPGWIWIPAAFRALGPLDAIAQAAGRCNRAGKLETALLRVFQPEDAGCPPGVYKQARDLTATLLNREEGLSIDDPEGFEEYFRSLYAISSLEDRRLLEAIKGRDFREVRKHYCII